MSFVIGQIVEALNPNPPFNWKPARITALEPYLGRPGYRVQYLDATQEWHCHSGWQPERCIRDRGCPLGTLHLIESRPANEDTEPGCPIDGNTVETGHKLCVRCEADEKRAAECAALVTDFMTASNRIAACDDAGPDSDLALSVSEAE